MDDQLQEDKANVIMTKLEEINKQFFELVTSIDERLEAFSEYYDKEINEIIKILNVTYEPIKPSFLEKEKGESSKRISKIRFTKKTFKDKLINSPTREPVDKFKEIYQSLVNFMYKGNPRELNSYIIEYKGIYPRIMIILDDWEDITLLNDLLRFGFIDSIYIEPSNDFSKLKHFPEPILTGIRGYIKGVKPTRTIFTKIYTASPDREGDAVYFVKIGTLNDEEIEAQDYICNEKEIPIIDEDWVTKRRALGFHVLLMIMRDPHNQAKFWSYAMTDKAIVICKKDKDQQAGTLRTLQLFTQKIERNQFQGQQESHQQFCKILKSSGDHTCQYCRQK